MGWLVGLGVLGLVFFVAKANLKQEEDAKSLRIFVIFYSFSSILCLLSLTWLKFLQIGDFFSSLVENVKNIL